MYLLVAGVFLFAAVHLFPAALQAARDRAAERLGNNAYRGIFALVILGSIIIIVAGWKAASPTPMYAPPLDPGPITSALMFAALVLFVAAQLSTNIKRFVRHPQLTGVTLWSIAHLLANGDSRSLVLFGSLGVWAIVEMLLCNRRDGSWSRAKPVSLGADLLVLVITSVAFAALAYFHRWLFGVAVGPGLPSW
jgi:uncharacterized membrane protein